MVYGGSFDPPHVGHVLAAAWALTTAAVDELIAIPAWQHPLGKSTRTAFEHRFHLCELTLRALQRVTVSRVEEELGGDSRTLRTLEELARRRPGDRFRLLIGADILQETSRWHRWDAVAQLAPPLVVSRGGYPTPEGCPVELPRISSTMLREKLAAGDDVTGLMAPAALAYIEEHGLYARPR